MIEPPSADVIGQQAAGGGAQRPAPPLFAAPRQVIRKLTDAENAELEKLGQWAFTTCRLFGSTIWTAHLVAGEFTKSLYRVWVGIDQPPPDRNAAAVQRRHDVAQRASETRRRRREEKKPTQVD